MPYLEKADLYTHIYEEKINAITRDADASVDAAINEAILMAKSYLSRFDLDKLFNPAVIGFYADANLKAMVKDIAVWRLCRLANVGIDLELAKDNYDTAISWLKDVQKGTSDPEGWPYKTDDADTDYPEGSAVSYITNTKQNHRY